VVLRTDASKMDLKHAGLIANRDYVGQPYRGRVVYFTATEGGPPGRVEAWTRFFEGQADVEELPGDHFAVFTEPVLSLLGSRLRAHLDAARGQLDGGRRRSA
jgi:thioesterase domain-containing protein